MRLRELMILFVLSLVILSVLASAKESGTTLTLPPWNQSMMLRRVDGFRLGLMTAFRERFDEPRGVFCTVISGRGNREKDGTGERLSIFSVNKGNGEILFNRNNWTFSRADLERDGESLLDGPLDIAGDTLGNLFVADSGNDRIVRFSFDGEGLVLEGKIDSAGGLPLNNPSGVDISGGSLYIADTGNDRVLITDYDGNLREEIISSSGGQEFSGPLAVCAVSEGDCWYYYNDHFIAVIDSLGQRLWKISGNGKRDGVVRRRDIIAGEGSFEKLATDYYSNIFLTDPSGNAIHKLDRHLNLIVTLGGGRENSLRLSEPRGISIFRRYGQVVITEKSGLRYFWVGTDLIDFAATDLTYDDETDRYSVEISFLLTEHSTLDIYLDGAGEEEILYFARDFLLPGGHFMRRIEVDGQGVPFDPEWRPHLVAIAKPTYSSTNYLTVKRRSEILKPLGR